MEQRVYLGKGSSKFLAQILNEYQAKKVLVIHGKKSYELCGAKRLIDSLNVTKTEFSDFRENPDERDVKRGLSLVTDDIDAIIAIGGGSVLDMGKLLRFFHCHKENKTGYERIKHIIPLIAIPTTAGTGAEATQFAVMYRGQIKHSIDNPNILPDVAIVDPVFTYQNPKYLTACTAFDALAQAIESYWNRNATPQSDEYALRAIRLLYPSIKTVFENNSLEDRDNLSAGSYWAGKAINITRTTAPHAFSYPFTAYYGYPHGHAVALTFPQIAEININTIGEKGVTLRESLKMGSLTTSDYFGSLLSYIGLKNCCVNPSINKNLILNEINLERLKNNPVLINHKLALSILENL